MEADLLFYVATVYLFAGFVKGFSGLGFSAISIGILATFLEMTTAIPLVVIPSIASSLLVIVESGSINRAVKTFRAMYLAIFPGLAIGIWLLVGPEGAIAKTVLGILLLIYAVWALFNSSFAIPERLHTRLNAPIGFLTGALSGLTGVSVMPVTPYLLSLNLSPVMFVQTLNIAFVITSSLLVFALGAMGKLNMGILLISVIAILPVALSVKAGVILRRRASDKGFRIAVLLVQMFLGLNLVVFS
ncbi:MAG: sulfite exporter TauE/SafE family protein [Gammaproteobacteria bacterium]